MTDLEAELRHDRTLRNAAKRLLRHDVAAVKGDVSERGLGGRMLDRARDGASEAAQGAAGYADEHRAQVGTGLAVGIGALLAYIFRDRVMGFLEGLFEEDRTPLESAYDRARDEAERLADTARSYLD